MLPGKNGDQVLEEIRLYQVPVIMMTGSETNTISQYLPAGANVIILSNPLIWTKWPLG